MIDYQDTERRASRPTTGAKFQRAVGADAEKWAAAFLVAYALVDHNATPEARRTFVASWFRDAMDAALRLHTEPDVQ